MLSVFTLFAYPLPVLELTQSCRGYHELELALIIDFGEAVGNARTIIALHGFLGVRYSGTKCTFLRYSSNLGTTSGYRSHITAYSSRIGVLRQYQQATSVMRITLADDLILIRAFRQAPPEAVSEQDRYVSAPRSALLVVYFRLMLCVHYP